MWTVKTLIESLQALPADLSVRLLDFEKTLGALDVLDEDGLAEGIYEDFGVSEVPPENRPEGVAPWIAITFNPIV